MKARFAEFVLDLDTRELLRDGERVHLSAKALKLLAYLLSNAPAAISKDDLYQHLWGDLYVAEANISNLVFELRTALGDDRKSQRFIRTIHRFGYRFVADVEWTGEEPRSSQPARWWLDWGAKEVPLHEGENIIGRDRNADVPVDSAGVSRRHAVLEISRDRALIWDLGSKNGTFVGKRRADEAIEVADGEVIRIGSVSMVFRKFHDLDTTMTEAEQ